VKVRLNPRAPTASTGRVRRTVLPFAPGQGSRKDVVQALKPVSASRRAQALHADSETGLTCYMAVASAALAQDMANKDASIAYISPLPPMLKVSKSLLDQARAGELITAPAATDAEDTSADKACGIDIRVSLVPEALGATDQAVVKGWIDGQAAALRSGDFVRELRKHFFWVASDRHEYTDGPREGGKLRRKAGKSVTGTPVGGPAAEDWEVWLEPVLDGSITCDFEKLEVSAEHFPYPTLTGLCPLLAATSVKPGAVLRLPGLADDASEAEVKRAAASSCLLTAAAFVSLDPKTLHLSPVPRFVPNSFPVEGQLLTLGFLETNGITLENIADGSVANESVVPFWESGIYGAGQIIQVRALTAVGSGRLVPTHPHLALFSPPTRRSWIRELTRTLVSFPTRRTGT
jgi:hypothetical protein